MIREAKFCYTKKNRYFLKREWDRSKGLLLVGNIFTKITPNPKEVDKSRGMTNKNFEELLKLINKVDQIVYAWGNSIEEPKILKDLISNPKCFGKNLNGTPKHPLYLPSSSKLESYRD